MPTSAQQERQSIKHGMTQLHTTCAVGHRHSACIWTHVADDRIKELAFHGVGQMLTGELVDIAFNQVDIRPKSTLVDGLQVNGYHNAAVTHALGSNLRPTTGAGTQIKNPRANAKQLEPIVKFSEFVRAPSAIALFFGELEKVVLYFLHSDSLMASATDGFQQAEYWREPRGANQNVQGVARVQVGLLLAGCRDPDHRAQCS